MTRTARTQQVARVTLADPPHSAVEACDSGHVLRFVAPASPTIPPAILQIAELFDGRRTLGQVSAEAQISEDRVLALVKKLTGLGCLEHVPTPPPRRRDTAETPFSGIEQAFFDGEVRDNSHLEDHPPSLGERIRLAFSDWFAARALR